MAKTRQAMLNRLAQSSMTKENLLSIVEGLLTSQEQLNSFLPLAFLEQLNTLGKGGVTSMTDSIGILMRWYDILQPKQKVKLWTLIVDFLILGTPVGMPSHEQNSG